MKISENIIQQLLLEKNKNNHEASKCVECKFGDDIKDGKWVEHKDIPNLDKFAQPVYMDEKGALLYPVSHNLIIGSTGSGKTTVLYDNCIDFYAKLSPKIRPSFLVLDLKGDMYVRHAKKLEKKGYKVRVMDMRNPYYSSCYNPLATIYECYQESYEIEKAILNGKIGKTFKGVTYDTVAKANKAALSRTFELKDTVDRYINEIADLLIVNTDPKNLSWTEGGRNCLKAIIYTLLFDSEKPDYELTKEKFTISNVARTAFNTGDDYEDIIKWLERAKHRFQVVSGALSSVYKLKASITRDGYTSSMTAELNKYTSRSIEALTSKNDISVSDIAKSDDDYAIFLVTDSRAQATNVVAMMFINDLINTLTDTADKKDARCLDKDFVILADEMGNLPQVPNMCNKITTLRSRKIWLHMSVQSVEQLQHIYKEEVMKTIVDNCDTHFFLGSNSQASKQYFADSLGKQIGIVTSANIQGTGEANASMSTGNVPVARMSDMESLNLGEFYVRSRVCPNLKSKMTPYFMRKDIELDNTEFKMEYNGFDPGMNAYYIQNVLIDEDLVDSFDTEKSKKIVPKKSPLITKINKIENAENNIEYVEEEKDDGAVFITSIEKNTPKRTYYNRLSADPKTIAKKIVLDIKENIGVSEYKDKLVSIVALGVLPEKIQREIPYIDENTYMSLVQTSAWLSFFKNELLFDKTLKYSEGKEEVLKEIRRRCQVIETFKCCSQDIQDAYEEVYSCVESMTPIQYIKFCKRINKK